MELSSDSANAGDRPPDRSAERKERSPSSALRAKDAGSDSKTRIGNPDEPTPSSVLKGELPPTGTHALSDSTLTGKQQVPATIGRYEVIQKIGRGGMGAVYLAKDPQLDRLVAIKVPHTEAEHDDGEARFWREARTAARLHHANICPVHEIGTENGRNFLVMAYIEGLPLSRYVEKFGPLSQRDAAIVVRKVALAMHEAHRVDIIHRDLKPSNIMIDRHREPIIMDFGLAWQAAASDVRLTRQGVVVGTPAYMPPEQIHRKWGNLGPQTDVYSLGVVLYELLTRRLPFEGDFASVVAQVVARKPPPPSQYRPDIDPKLEAICLKAMSKKADERYADMAALAADLTDFIRNPTPPGAVVLPKEADVEVIEEPIAVVETRKSTKRSTVRRTVPPSSVTRSRRKKRRSDEETLRVTMKLLFMSSACIAVLMIAVAVVNRLGHLLPSRDTAEKGASKEVVAGAQPKVVSKEAPDKVVDFVQPVVKTIQQGVDSVEIFANHPTELKVMFPGLYSLEGHWAVASARVSLDGNLIYDNTVEEPATWSDTFRTTEMSPAAPSYTLPSTVVERLMSEPGPHELVVSVELIFPKIVSGEHFANDFKSELRKIKAVVK